MQTIEVIRLLLLDHSQTFDELAAWMRRRRPRVMLDAIGFLLLQLKHRGRVRIIDGRWEACRPVLHMPLGPPLRPATLGVCEECGSDRHDTLACPQLRRAMESPAEEREEEAA